MVRRAVALIASVVVVSAIDSVQDACDANDKDCEVADVSLAQLRLRMHAAKTNASETANQTSNIWGNSGNGNGPPRHAECFALGLAQCDAQQQQGAGIPGLAGRCSLNQECYNGHCVCTNGCAGDDGNCYQQGNQLVMRKFTLRNAAKTSSYMYVKKLTSNNQINTVSGSWAWSKMGADQFRLYELPPGPQFGARRRYLLVSEQWPNWAVSTWPVEGKYQPYMLVARELTEVKSLAEVAMLVCDMGPRGFPGQVAIGGTHDGKTIAGSGFSIASAFNIGTMGNGNSGGTVWANLDAPSSYVYGTSYNPGDAGRWIVGGTSVPEGALPSC